jgi:PAS domain S-box-containing protein
MENMTKEELITELKRMKRREERYRTLLDDSSDPIFAFNREGEYLYVNRIFTECVGNCPPEDVIGKTLWDLFPKEEADHRFAVVKGVFESRTPVNIEVQSPNTEEVTYHLTTAKPIFDANGEVSYVICIAKDITEHKLRESALNQRTKELEIALKEVKELQGIVPICSYCKKTRDDEGYWSSVEVYISNHTGAELTHGICPDCLPQVYKEAGIEQPTC